MKKKLRKERGLAISQIILLIVGIIAISYVVGESMDLVSAQGQEVDKDCIKGTNAKLSNIDQNAWCENNGRSAVCSSGGSGSGWRINQDQLGECTGGIEGVGTKGRFSFPLVFPSNLLRSGTPRTQTEEAVTRVARTTPAKAGTWSIVKGFAADAAIALGIYFGGRELLKQTGMDPELADSIAAGAAAGYATYQILIPLANKLGTLLSLGTIGGPWGLIISGVIAGIVFIFTYKKTKYVVITFSCYPWDAPSGGKDCEECNKQDLLSCGEYQCRSLGRSCAFLDNEGLCYYNNTGDVKPPVIQPWEDILTPEYIYTPDDAINPPDRGVKIVREDGGECVAPYTSLRFGVMLNEPAKCKIDTDRKRDFEDMGRFFGGSPVDGYNHSHTLSIPSPDALAEQNITLQNDGEFSLYVRCEDQQGNTNPANFVFRFCVDEGPDWEAPVIKETSIFNGMPIGFNQTSIDLDIFVNEPAECKWSHLNKIYDDMETDMSCSTNVLEMNARLLYGCSTTLTGLKDMVDNDFYFRCKDQPHLAGTDREGDRNTNQESYKFTLVGTRPLVIDWVKPNGTIKDSTDIVRVDLEVKTSAGFNEGEATCYFSDRVDGGFVQFPNPFTHQHSQRLDLPEGDYTYYIRCNDLGGNSDSATISFAVESDSTAPVVVRVYHEENYLKLITNEKAECVYDTVDCSYLFEDGIEMNVVDETEHFTTWDSDNDFYIKCQDEFGNKPFPDDCSIRARPFEI